MRARFCTNHRLYSALVTVKGHGYTATEPNNAQALALCISIRVAAYTVLAPAAVCPLGAQPAKRAEQQGRRPTRPKPTQQCAMQCSASTSCAHSINNLQPWEGGGTLRSREGRAGARAVRRTKLQRCGAYAPPLSTCPREALHNPSAPINSSPTAPFMRRLHLPMTSVSSASHTRSSPTKACSTAQHTKRAGWAQRVGLPHSPAPLLTHSRSVKVQPSGSFP